MSALKMLSDNRVGGYLVVWGSPSQKDLQKEYFTPQSELGLDWYTQRPVLYHHGLDGTMKATVIGTIDTLKADQTGVWAEAQLLMHNQYVEQILQLIKNGVLGWSSGSLPHLVEVASDGQIKRWPVVEGSLTPTPAEPRRTSVSTIKSAYAALGLDSTRLEGQDATAENVSVENAPSLKELCAKAEIVIINTDDGAAEDEETSEALEPIENTTPGGVTVDIQAIIASVLQAITATGVQLTPDQQTAITQAVTAACGQDATMSAIAAAPVPVEQFPAVAKSVGVLVAAEVVKITAVQKAQQNAVAEAAKTAMVGAMAGQGGTSKLPGFQATPEQEKPALKANITAMNDRKFDHLSASDITLAAQVAYSNNIELSDGFVLAMAYKTAQQVERGDKAATTWAMKAAFPFTKAADIFAADHSAIKTGMKANEIMGTTQSGFGSQYANTYYSGTVWQVVRQESLVYDKMISLGMDEKEVPQGSVSETIPLEGADMTWYVGGPATDELANSAQLTPGYSSSKYATSNKAVTLARLSARTYLTRELTEDSIVDIIPETNRKLQVSGKEQIEYVLLNGDTATGATTNINTIDGTPGTAPTKPAYLLLDGLLKLPLVTDTAATYAAASTLGDGTFLNLRPLMDADHVSGRNSVDPNKFFYIIDNRTYFAMLAILSIKNQNVFKAATLESGEVSKIWGSSVIPSVQMAIANTAGKVATGTPANNVAGRVLAVRPDQWAARWKSQIEIFTSFDPDSYAYKVSAHMRWGLQYRANGASAVAVNVSITIPA